MLFSDEILSKYIIIEFKLRYENNSGLANKIIEFSGLKEVHRLPSSNVHTV
jgi:hypothetical protein